MTGPLARLGILVAALAALFAAAPVSATEDHEVELFSVARARGALMRMGEQTLQFVGSVQGGAYIQGDEGPLRAGIVVCSATIDIDTASRAQSGSGRCTIASDEGGEVYGKWTCAGFFLIGCSGPFTITGGSGRFKGMTGEGPITLRSALAKSAGAPAEASGLIEFEGIVFWRKLKFRTP